MPDGFEPDNGTFDAPGSGFDLWSIFPFVFGGILLLFVVMFVFVVVRLITKRKVYAQYEADVLKLPGAILAAVERGDTQGAQLLQQQLALSQQLAARRGGASALSLNNPGMFNGQPLGMQDFNGDGIPGN